MIYVCFATIESKCCILILLKKDNVWSYKVEFFKQGGYFFNDNVYEFSQSNKVGSSNCKAMSRLNLLQITVKVNVLIIRRMLFIIERQSDFVDRKNKSLPVNSSFIIGESKVDMKYLSLISQKQSAKKYEATISRLISLCFAIIDSIRRSTAHFLSFSIIRKIYIRSI